MRHSRINGALRGLVLATLLAGSAFADKPRRAHAPAAGVHKVAAPTPAAAPADAPLANDKNDKGVVGQPSGTPPPGAANVVATEEGKEGVKTYKFGAVEVESRLRSPELIYFLRRVRAEFVAGDLGHRSFLRELDDTARSPSFR
ncbi:MAG TPA: hypothetical protein VH142_09400 [Polyangiaceae bacterium]|jgi:hypothetical protein|nr:hypothetical protein [Polyangiaceae bacterium]